MVEGTWLETVRSPCNSSTSVLPEGNARDGREESRRRSDVMGLFSGVLSGNNAYPTNEPEAVLGILLSVIAADGDISDDEVQSFMYLANNTKALGPMPADTFRRHIDTCQSFLRREGPVALMEKCCVHVSADKRLPLFINSCDLIMRDGRVEAEEEALIESLQQRLGVDSTTAQSAVSLILSKYAL